MNAAMTMKQLAIMDVVFAGSKDGGFVDIYELMERTEHKATLQAMQCSLKFLIKHGLIERHKAKAPKDLRKRLYGPTPLAFEYLRAKPAHAEDAIEIEIAGTVSVGPSNPLEDSF